ncbi:MAG: poly-beta-1,6-N-acetyl-D-glucosamine N-deacetylase PgaB [Kiritimatiellae bacterium]|nr:poly-beta-1,6-N-acetyl-D-glucosamine N-deacetylase PgaB [Kiritimatiellia bacterium]
MAATYAVADPLQPETLEQIEKKLAQSPNDTGFLATKGAMQRQAQDYTGAAKTYDRILALTPDDARSRNLLVMVLHKAAEESDPAQALPLMRRAVSLAPEADFLKPAYLTALHGSGATSELVKAYEGLPEGYELPAAMLVAVADAYREAGQRSEAAAIYRTILDAAPADADAGLGLALALLDDERYPDALEAIQRTIGLNPQRPTLLLALAAIQWQSGGRVLALDTFDEILELDPQNADAVNLKAQLLCDMGCISLAQEVVTAHAPLMWVHVRRHVESSMAEAQAAWNETGEKAEPLPEFEPDELLALCYYDVADLESRAATVVSSIRFLQHIEYLRTHDYNFVSAGDVVAARRGEHSLPDNAVLLTFDHGYAGIIKHVIPVLELYNIPAIVSVCPAWIENGPPMDLSGPLMSWEEIGQLAGHRLVTLGLEAEGLFELVCGNPQGDAGFAAMTRMYDAATKRYETEAEQRSRIQATLGHALRLTKERVGSRPRVLVWSHGARNAPAAAEAERLGFVLQLGLHAQPHVTDTEELERVPVLHGPAVGRFIALVKPTPPAIPQVRAVSVSMDAINAPTETELDGNIIRLAQRLRNVGANTVILSACADADGDGNAEAAYFPTAQLPVLHDALDHVVARLQGARFRVLLELPVLSFERPATPRHDTMRVMEARTAGVRPSFSLQKRYSPFHPDVTSWITQLYRDLAGHVRCDGIVFGEDAYLTDSEDYNAAAQKVYAARIGTPTPGTETLSPAQEQAWVRLKTETLNRLTTRLGKHVQRYRPRCELARAVFAPLLHYPESERWFAQNYKDALTLYDHVLLMAYAEMEDIRRPDAWLAKLVDLADAEDNGLEKTIFMLQAVDWERHKPVKASSLRSRLRHMAHSGALHMAYGPDAPLGDVPAANSMKQALSEDTRARR